MKTYHERDIEAYLVKGVRQRGGIVRKVQWIRRNSAPDRVVMLTGKMVWVELKNPQTVKTFPSGAHEHAQHREHERMRAVGQRVEVVGTFDAVDALLTAYDSA